MIPMTRRKYAPPLFGALALLGALGLPFPTAAKKPEPQAACDDNRNRTVNIINQHDTALTHILASPAEALQWSENRIKEGVIAEYSSKPVSLGDGSCTCKMDLKLVFADGSVDIRPKTDICKTGSLRLR
jgi:hypothetical protein